MKNLFGLSRKEWEAVIDSIESLIILSIFAVLMYSSLFIAWFGK